MQMTETKKILYYLGWLTVILLWVFMHIYRINEVPSGIHIDEAGTVYDAFCILNWGVDRYLNPFPLYFYHTGGGQSAAYTYLCAFFIKILGMKTIAFRMPAVIFSFITMIFSSLIVKKCYGKQWAFLNAVLFCILPYFTMQSRFGLDCNLMLGAAAFCIWMTIEMLEKNKTWMYILTGIFWGLGLYTYVLSYLVFPVFLLLIFIWLAISRIRGVKHENIAEITFGKICMIVLPMVIVSLPLIVMVIINTFDLNMIRTKYFTIYKLENSRAGELSVFNIKKNIIKVLCMIFTYDSAPFDAFPNFYTMYPISIPICIVGFLYGIYRINSDRKRKIFGRDTIVIQIMIFYFLAQILTGSAQNASSIYRMNGVFVSMLFLLVSGFYAIYQFVIKIWKKVSLSCMTIIIILSIFIWYFFRFSNFYFNTYPNTIYSYYLFSARLDKVVGAFDIPIQTYKTYFDTYYLYYMIEKQMNPYLAEFTYKEMNQFGDITFNSMYTAFPEDINQYDIYVISRWDTNTIDLLSSYPFEQYWTEDYIIFYDY